MVFEGSVCSLSIVLVGWFFANSVLKKNVLFVQGIVAVVLLMFGFWCSRTGRNFFDIAQAASFYCLYFIGHNISKYRESYIHLKWRDYLFIFIVSFVILALLNRYGEISLSTNNYKNPFYLLCTSVSGWAFLYSLSFFIKQNPHIKNIFICIGRNTLHVLCLHFLCMKLITVIVVVYYSLPSFCIAAFPNLYGERGLWWLAYTIVGVGMPVFVGVVYNKLRNLFLTNFTGVDMKFYT